MSSFRSHRALASLLAFLLGLAPGVPPARAEDATGGRTFQYNKAPNPGISAIRRVDRESGREETLTRKQGSSVRPEISPDGMALAFVRRVRLKSALMLRALDEVAAGLVDDAGGAVGGEAGDTPSP